MKNELRFLVSNTWNFMYWSGKSQGKVKEFYLAESVDILLSFVAVIGGRIDKTNWMSWLLHWHQCQ